MHERKKGTIKMESNMNENLKEMKANSNEMEEEIKNNTKGIKEEMKDEMKKMRGEMRQIGRGLQAGTARMLAIAGKMATPRAGGECTGG